jgi:hypothetical protein
MNLASECDGNVRGILQRGYGSKTQELKDGKSEFQFESDGDSALQGVNKEAHVGIAG